MVTITIEQVCDWIKSSPYTDIISNLTDATPEEIIGDFLNYINNLPDAQSSFLYTRLLRIAQSNL